jgi:hypothetical protein
MSEERKSVDRREFLRKAAITGAVAAWAVPAIQTVAATPAFAQTAGTAQPCQHSLGGKSGGGCMAACQGGCGGDCNDACSVFCRVCPGNFCYCDAVCDPANWTNCAYTGPACGTTCP